MSHVANCSCEICEKMVYRNPNNMPAHVACGAKCRSELNKMLNGANVKCDNCGVEFYKKNSRITKANFCSDECAVGYRAVKFSIEDVVKLSLAGLYDREIAEVAGCSRSQITIMLNNAGYNGRKSKIEDHELRARISTTNRGTRTGVDNHRFKGVSSFEDMARGLFNSMSRQYMLKNKQICEICGVTNKYLATHHIKPFSVILSEFLVLNPDITTDEFSDKILKYSDFIDEYNLVLTCRTCHDAIHHKGNPELSKYRWGSATTIESAIACENINTAIGSE